MAFGSQKKGGPVSDINVTPLVDVMLVLLVIFMVTAPLMFNGIQLDLPKTKKVHNLNLHSEQVILSVSKAGEYFIGDDKLLEKELVARIKGDFTKFKNDTLFLRAHYNLRYGKIAKLMSFLKSKGISKIALVTEIEKE